MPTPTLLHAVSATIKIIDKAGTTYNENAGEPVRSAKKDGSGDLKTIPAQVHWGSEDDPDVEKAGVVEKSSGWITLRKKDLVARAMLDEKGNPGVPRGSEIIKLGKQIELELFVTKSKPLGHWPDREGYTLVRIYFRDRKG